MLVLVGCGKNVGATTPKKVKKHPTATAATASATVGALAAVTPVPTVSPTVAATSTTVPTVGSTARPRPTRTTTPRVVAGPPHLISAIVLPVTLAPGGSIAATVVTTGPVSRVDLYIGSGLPNMSGPIVFRLVQGVAGRWNGGGAGPSVPGQYHYSVGLYDRAGTRTIVDNDAWNMTVTGSATGTSGPQPLPADIPLAPPFSYGNPVAAVFNADGKSINGSEVTSVTRADIAPSVVAQFYNNRLPRAGWTLQSSAPPGGAPSFSVQAVKGAPPSSRVCIVQYSSSTIHIFYGTIAG